MRYVILIAGLLGSMWLFYGCVYVIARDGLDGKANWIAILGAVLGFILLGDFYMQE